MISFQWRIQTLNLGVCAPQNILAGADGEPLKKMYFSKDKKVAWAPGPLS